MSSARRPNPARSWYPTCAPIATPRAAASSHTRRITDGSPAWKPHATVALGTMSSMAASSPIFQAPKPSPRSLFRSISVHPVFAVVSVGDEHVPGRGGERERGPRRHQRRLRRDPAGPEHRDVARLRVDRLPAVRPREVLDPERPRLADVHGRAVHG